MPKNKLRNNGTLTEGFLELCKMGKHDDETKQTDQYYVLYTLSLPCQKENISPQKSTEFYQLCEMMNECLVLYYCLSHSCLCQYFKDYVLIVLKR